MHGILQNSLKILLLAIVSISLPTAVPAQEEDAGDESPAVTKAERDPRVGQKVIVVKAGAELRTPAATVWKAYLGDTYTVALTNGKWLWIEERRGWLWEDHVLPFDEAVTTLSKTVVDEPTAENFHTLGIALAAHGQFDRAIENFSRSLQEKEGDAGVLNNRGQAKYNSGQMDAAIQDFTAAAKADAKHFVALNNRSLCYIAKDDLKAALKDVNAAIRLNRKYPEALNNRGIIHSRMGDFKSAVKDFTAALEVDENYVDVYESRAFAYRSLGQYSKALEDLRTAIAKRPLSFEPVNDLAWVMATTDDSKVANAEEAIKLATKACQMTQYSDWNTLDTLAAAYAAGGDFKSAIQWVSTALEKAPEENRAELRAHLALFEKETRLIR